jgi:hypothetical protein
MKRLLLTLVLLAPACHTLDRYRPAPHPIQIQAPAADPRPDLAGKPTVPGDALWRMEQDLRRLFPTDRAVVVRWSPLKMPYLGVTHPDCPGWLAGDGAGWDPVDGPLVIEVNDDPTLQGWQARDILIHEYAHALAWDAPESPHGPVWASYFGLIYKATRGER